MVMTMNQHSIKSQKTNRKAKSNDNNNKPFQNYPLQGSIGIRGGYSDRLCIRTTLASVLDSVVIYNLQLI